MIMKILSPVGDFESLKMAVFNGADEIYLGITDFNARSTNGFNMTQLQDVVNFSHLYGVKVLLAVNILFTDSELQHATDLIVDAYNMGVDAFIVQDFGLITILHNNYPQIELHASTQMGIHNLAGVKFLEKYGIKRVVLARETPLDEIKNIKEHSNVEIEYFAHGALCISFSGNCYLSSYHCSASGNRGKCKQLCRLPYTLKNGNKKLAQGYLISAKDFNMLDRLKDLENAGVDVIKIEGRARRPFYVATATKAYYNALHGLKVDRSNLNLAFNRDFTEGYFNGNGNIVSKYNNHIGINVGRVVKVNKGKKFNEVFVESKYPLSPKSLFKVFVNDEEKVSFTAYDIKEISKNNYRITTTLNIPLGDLHLIVDNNLEQQTLNEYKKIPINIDVSAESGKAITATAVVNGDKVVVAGDICDTAKNQPLSLDEIKQNFLKSEYFDSNVTGSVKNAFLPKQKLNEFRRNVFDKIYNVIIENKKQKIEKIKITTNLDFVKLSDFSIVETINDRFLTKNMVFSPETYNFENVQKFINKCKQNNCVPYLDLPNFALTKDVEYLKSIVDATKISIIANNYYALDFDTNIVVGGGLNVFNSVTANSLGHPVLIAEGKDKNIQMPYMTLLACPFKNHLHASCDKCPYSSGYYLEMQDGTKLNISRKKLSNCIFYLK